MKKLLAVLFILILGCQNTPKNEVASKASTSQKRGVASLGEATSTGDNYGDDVGVIVGGLNETCFSNDNPHFALNKDTMINGKTYPRDTQFTIYETENGFEAIAHLKDGSGSESDADGTYDIISANANAFSCDQLTQIPMETDANGEVVLGKYSLPIDFDVAGPGQEPRARSGVTYCYREVKRIVRHKITLTGRSAYMANAQLKKAGWRRYTSYSRAPQGSVCVFGPGGKKTSSGGHKHGHIGIKGRGGVIDPQAGFRLKRPFWGCYYK